MAYLFLPASRADLPCVWDLYGSAIENMKKAGIDQWDELYPTIAILEKDIASGTMHLLKNGGDILAAAVLNEHQDAEYAAVDWQFRTGKIMVVHRLCVDPSRQGLGVGKATMGYLEALAREMGCACLRLDAFCGNAAALRLYGSLGYVLTGTVQYRKGTFHCFEKLV